MQSAPVLREYEESLVHVQRVYRRLAAAHASERAAAEADYERALQRAREVGARVRVAIEARAA